MGKATVKLTAAHVAGGFPRKPKRCPVFLACDAVMGSAVYGVRGDGTVVVRSPLDRYGVTARMSKEDQAAVREAVERIDHGMADDVEPFSFTLEWD